MPKNGQIAAHGCAARVREGQKRGEHRAGSWGELPAGHRHGILVLVALLPCVGRNRHLFRNRQLSLLHLKLEFFKKTKPDFKIFCTTEKLIPEVNKHSGVCFGFWFCHS